MLKYADIIHQLSDSAKIHLLSDLRYLSDKEYKTLGIPAIKIGHWNDYCQNDYPTIEELSNSWDVELISRVAQEVFARMVQDKVTLAVIPGPKARINPFRRALCEDPLLARALSIAYANAAHAQGLACCLSNFSLYRDELEWLDTPVDVPLLREYLIKPFADVMQETSCETIMLEYDGEQDTETATHQLYHAVRIGAVGQNVTPLLRSVSAEQTVSAILHGNLCLKCSASALENALERYHQLKKTAERNQSGSAEIEQECALGTAISPKTIDEAVDRVLSFAHAQKHPLVVPIETDPALPLQATMASGVLLKNDNHCLPLAPNAKICLLGDIRSEATPTERLADQAAQQLTQAGYTVIGTAAGYDINTQRSEKLLSEAVSLCKEADTIIVFLGHESADREHIKVIKKLAIPANQQQLLDHIKSCEATVIAVLPGGYSPDIGLADACTAILQLPLSTQCTTAALEQIITGRYNPQGRLANTVYVDFDRQYTQRNTHRRRDGMKIGPFIGYRYYDREHISAGFPFGHGYTFSSFLYSQLNVSDGKAHLTITNTGSQRATETVQIYAGAAASSLIRPLKELSAFTRVALEPNEQKTVELPLQIPKVYLTESSSWVCEQGRYIVTAGPSLTHASLTQAITLQGTKLDAPQANLSNYIPSESNILIDQFTLEAEYTPMKKSVFNLVAGAISLVLAITLKLYCQFTDVGTTFFNIFTVVLLLCGVSFFVKEAVSRNQAYHEADQNQQLANNALFEDAQPLPVYEAKNMFVKEFDEVEDTMSEADKRQIEINDMTMAHVDKTYTLAAATQDLVDFAAQKGVKFSMETASNLLASLSCSRMAILYNVEQNQFRTLMGILSSFFNTSLHIDKMDALYKPTDSIWFKNDGQGHRLVTNTFSAMNAAKGAPKSIHLVGLTDVTAGALAQQFAPLAAHIKNPYGRHSVSVLNENNVERPLPIPENLWFVLNLSPSQSIASLPDFATEAATLNTFAFDACPPSTKKLQSHQLTYFQLEYWMESMVNASNVQENHWKKVDRLVEFVSARHSFRIGNKMWLLFEKYVLTATTCGLNIQEALDFAISAKLLPAIIALEKAETGEHAEWLTKIASDALGEDHMQSCKNLLQVYAHRSSK